MPGALVPVFCTILCRGTARGESDKFIPWIVKKDTDTMIHVTENGKVATCLSEIACSATQRQGLTELTMVDHALSQRHKDLIRFGSVEVWMSVFGI